MVLDNINVVDVVVAIVVVYNSLNIDKSSKQAYTGTEQRVSCGSWPKCDAKGAEEEPTEIQYGEEENLRRSFYALNGRGGNQPIRIRVYPADLNNLFSSFLYNFSFSKFFL